MSAPVRDTDKGYAKLLARLKEAAADPAIITVGIHAAEGAAPKTEGEEEGGEGGAEPGLTLVEVASYHEFGIGVPRRSFIADWSDENRANHEEQLRRMAKAVVKGQVPSFRIGLERLGNLYVGEIQKRIADGIEPPLAPATIKAKGSSKPLIDTGQLRSSVTYKVRSGRVGDDGGAAGSDDGGGEE